MRILDTREKRLGRLPAGLLEQTVRGLNLRPGTLADQLEADSATLIIFLRHLG